MAPYSFIISDLKAICTLILTKVSQFQSQISKSIAFYQLLAIFRNHGEIISRLLD